MKKKLFMLSAITGLLLTSSSCNKENDGDGIALPNAEPIVLKEEFKTKSAESRNFAFELFKHTVARSGGENVLVSPLSVNTALGMTWNGAEGETAREMSLVLGNDGYTRDQVNEYAKTLNEALLKVDPSTELSIANSIWADRSTPFVPSFVQTNRLWYNATVENMDFRKPETLKAIDQWGLDHTGNRIDNISEGMTENTRFALINALYFKGIWKNRFEKSSTARETFTNRGGEKTTVEMMNQQGNFDYADDQTQWKMLSLPYGNGAFNMVILMPYIDTALDEQIHALSAEKFLSLLHSSSLQPVSVKLPKFKADYKYRLEEEILPAMGMKLAFSPDAELNNICNADMCIEAVLHKTAVEVDEQGTVAAAVTVVQGFLTSVGPVSPINFFADRPFVYAIMENSTETILFIGRINSL